MVSILVLIIGIDGAVQGKLVEDFASLLKSLWSQEYLCIFPSKFKRGLIKYKPQFAGNEQQDSQVLSRKGQANCYTIPLYAM